MTQDMTQDIMKWSIEKIRTHRGEPLVCLSVASFNMARLCDQYCDILLVGDSLGMTLYGESHTRAVTLEMMRRHTASVMKARHHALVVADIPFDVMSLRDEDALPRITQFHQETKIDAIKIEGARIALIENLIGRGIAVMGHVGLTPQTATKMRMAGGDTQAQHTIMADALELERAGVFSMVVEAVPEFLARDISGRIKVPVIGIGASPACDGQILVIDDIIGLSARNPPFARRYEDASALIARACQSYAREVRNRQFPTPDECYNRPKQKKN